MGPHRQGCPFEQVTCQAALEGNFLQTVDWLLRAGCPYSAQLSSVGENGHLHVLQWVQEHAAWLTRTSRDACMLDAAMPATGFCEGAARGGYHHILDWAEQHCRVPFDRMLLAGIGGKFTMMQSLAAQGYHAQPGMWQVT